MIVIELLEKEIKDFDRHSSKGNQLKWERANMWYKADFTGYEGLVEYVVSRLLAKSTLEQDSFVLYETEQILYKRTTLRGCKSKNFIEKDWQIITLERLYKDRYNRSLMSDVWNINDVEKRLVYLVQQVENLTGFKNFGEYISQMITIDAFFLNEDRHMHNIAVLMNASGQMKLCPFFDQGAGLLADTTLDYPMDANVHDLIKEVKGKTIAISFDDALNAAEKLYGKHLQFTFTKKDIENILKEDEFYDVDIKKRVETVLYEQMRKYTYLF